MVVAAAVILVEAGAGERVDLSPALVRVGVRARVCLWFCLGLFRFLFMVLFGPNFRVV